MPADKNSPQTRQAASRHLRSIRGATCHAVGIALALLATLGGCVAPDRPVRLYSLIGPVDAARDAARSRTTPPAAAIPITLLPIRLPAQVDQPQILVQLDDDSLAALEQQRWASPLRSELREAVLERLAVHYGAVETRTGANVTTSPTDIRLVFRRFDSRPGREALIEGSWTITRTASDANRTLMCDWSIAEKAPGGVASLAQAHRRGVARLTDQIGSALTHPAIRTCPPVQGAPDGAVDAAG